MSGEQLIQAVIALRTAQGLGLRMWGIEERTEADPFTCYVNGNRVGAWSIAQ